MYDLDRFLTAQSRDYTTALREIRKAAASAATGSGTFSRRSRVWA